MFIELHQLQNFAPSNLNRDDTGNPKDCEFGGTRRARISSQCLKRAMRSAPIFAATTAEPNGVRSKRLVAQLVEKFPADQKAKAVEVISALSTAFLSKMDAKSKTAETAVLLYLSQDEQTAIAEAVQEQWAQLIDAKAGSKNIEKLAGDLAKQFKGRSSAPDIALFGRMLAENPELNIDAACQVAHAISTHRVTMDMDFYTAVDDLKGDDSAGAGMMGFTGFNSACFYRYLRLDLDQLRQNLSGDDELAAKTVEACLLAALEAVPSGKQNTFAAHNPPSLLLAVVRTGGQGWSLANAFEKPVQVRGSSGLVGPSIQALDAYWSRLLSAYGDKSVAGAWLLLLDDTQVAAQRCTRAINRDEWVRGVVGTVAPAQVVPVEVV
ncbi:MAG: type I-E CRISPR-associated protein Cas7/Cse4/CasC [Caldilineaceae bacterium]